MVNKRLFLPLITLLLLASPFCSQAGTIKSVEQEIKTFKASGLHKYAPLTTSRVEAYLGAAERVFVTEDSMTMLTEAIYSRRPVVSLRPQHAAPTARYERMIQGFADVGYLCRYALTGLSQQPELLENKQCRVLDASPLDDLAEQLGKRLGMFENG